MRCLFRGLISLLIMGSLLFVNSVGAADKIQKLQSADLTWSEFDGASHSIWFSSWQQQVWSQPQQIINDQLINILPQVDIAADGSRLLVWTSVEDSHLFLRYSQQKNGIWSEPKIVPSPLISNIAPSVLIDDQNVGWIVWAGNNGGLDDIYFSRLIDGVWQAPQRVHPVNKVPDILPRLSYDETGRLQVTWQSYFNGAYQLFMSTWDGRGWTVPLLQPKVDILPSTEKSSESSELILPDFVPAPQRAFLRKYMKPEHP